MYSGKGDRAMLILKHLVPNDFACYSIHKAIISIKSALFFVSFHKNFYRSRIFYNQADLFP